MWKKTTFALLFAVLASSVTAQNAAGTKDVVFTMSVDIDGSSHNMQLLRGDSYEDAAIAFARSNGLLNTNDDTRIRQVVDQLTGMLRGQMEKVQAAEAAKATSTRTVQLNFSLTIGQQTRDINKYVDESVEQAVERFLYEGGYTVDVMRELYPQLVDVLQRKVAELQPPRKQLLEFTVTIDNREAVVRHFEGGNPEDEARETLRNVGVTNEEFFARAIPQLADAIRQRTAALQQPVAPPPQQQAAAPPAPELFSIPLTMGTRPTVLVHYDGYTSRESAARYLRENGVAESTELMAQLVQIIDTRIAEIARERAEAEAAARAEAERRAVAEEAARQAEEAARQAAAAPQRQPIVRLPIEFGKNQAATLEYYEGDSVERTAELFLSRVIGLEEGPSFAQNVASLSDGIRRELNAIMAQRAAQQQPQQQAEEPAQPPQEPFVTLPVTLSGRVFDLVYYAGEQPATVANTFCVEKHEAIRSELGLQFNGDQLLECKNLLESTLKNMIAQKEQQQQKKQATATQPEQPEQQQQPPQQQQEASKPQPQRGELLMSLSIGIGGNTVPLPVHRGDNIEQITREFCQTHGVEMSNVPAMIEGIKAELARQGVSA